MDAENVPSMGSGRSLIKAMLEKFQAMNSLNHDESVCKIFISGSPGKREDGEVLIPPVVVMDNQGISEAGSIQEITKLCRGVRELDISYNLITDISEVMKVVTEMPRLTFLNMSTNDLGDFSCTDNLPVMPKIRYLALNKTRAPWKHIQKLLDLMPNLKELHLSLVGKSTVPVSDTCYPSVEHLSFNSNGVTEWAEICKLGDMFPNLKTLLVADNPISNFQPEDRIATSFPRVTSLCVIGTAITEWEDIDRLRNFPVLVEVQISGVPLVEDLEEIEQWQLPIARLPDITTFNKSKITDDERETCERAFIRNYTDNDHKPDRYYELEQKHGKLDALADVNLKPKMVATVRLKYENEQSVARVRLDLTVWDLRRKMAQWVKLPPNKFRLYLVQSDMSLQGPEEMKNNQKKLYTYNIRDGHELEIVPK
ncbi:PREDICTED: tubulin-specific chaperone cofactor E-like protein [Priapulus caudatus]|uniref:Tubulin-specific chaperone cofactor E-like protein n=1 Tax=Priapulus caudatus TaxID=37621 RepID=A0ABM1E337_PRICU|nr:PREDICTED: tubulin-specific chaperone cofactor E-like protein [Priapulus caudatus]XP_014666608.1 PREDICTED: tubulin-specific chaperone cofactor E-like protein [Priapulus caudatus]